MNESFVKSYFSSKWSKARHHQFEEQKKLDNGNDKTEKPLCMPFISCLHSSFHVSSQSSGNEDEKENYNKKLKQKKALIKKKLLLIFRAGYQHRKKYEENKFKWSFRTRKYLGGWKNGLRAG